MFVFSRREPIVGPSLYADRLFVEVPILVVTAPCALVSYFSSFRTTQSVLTLALSNGLLLIIVCLAPGGWGLRRSFAFPQSRINLPVLKP